MIRVYGARPKDGPILGAARIALPAMASGGGDLRPRCPRVLCQDGSQCTGEGYRVAHWLAVKGVGLEASPLGVYRRARAMERARKTDPLPDVGARANDVFAGLIDIGPRPYDAQDEATEEIERDETYAQTIASVPCLPEHFAVLDDGDVDHAFAHVTAGFGVWFCMDVDASYESLTTGQMWQGMQGPSKGGHAQCLVGFDGSGNALVMNSWGTGWGTNGFGWMTRGAFSASARDMVAVVNAPVLG